MAARAGTAYVDVRGDWGPFNRQLASQGRIVGRAGSKLGGQFGSAITRGATIGVKAGAVGLAGGIAFAVKKAADFEGQLSSLGAVSDANTRQMERFRKQALKAGADTKFSALQAAQAQTELAKGGLKVNQVLGGGLNAALALAAAGEMDLADAATTTVNAMKLFGLRGKDSMKVADALATAANRTTADVSDFALALSQGGSAAKAAGLNLDETVAALEALAETGIKGSDAGTSLKAMLMQLANPTKKAREEMQRLGLEVFDAQGNMKPLPKVAGELRSALGHLNREQRLATAGTLVGTDGMRALLALYDAGPKKITSFEKGLGKQGTAAEVAKKKQDNLKGSVEQLGGSLETLGINVGTAAIPAIRTAADEVTDLANKISRIASRDDLDLGEKLDRIFTVAKVDAQPWIDKLKRAVDEADLPGKLADGISAAAPAIGEAAAHAAPVAAGAFAKTWLHSSVWGRLAIGGWLLAKLGGPKAFRTLGERAGREMAPGIAAGVGAGAAAGSGIGAALGTAAAAQTVNWVRGPGGGMVAQIGTTMGAKAGASMGPAVATGLAGSGIKARLAGMMRGWGPLLAASLTATFGPEFAKAIQQGVAKKSIDFKLPAFEGTQGGIPGLRQLQHFSDRILDDEKKLKDFGSTAEHQLKKFAAAGDSANLAKLGDQARSLAHEFPRAAGELYKFADAADSAARDAVGSFRDVSRLGGKSLQRIMTATANAGFDIKQTLGTDTAAAKKALAGNFVAAAKAIKKSMDAGVVSTKDGTAQIEKYMVKALQNMGFTKEQALRVRAGQDPVSGKATGGKQNLTNKQRGGPIDIGDPTGDSVPALLERGEYVLNRKAVKKAGRAALDRLNFGAAPRFQQGGLVRRLARGGQVTGDTDFLPQLMTALRAMSGAAGVPIFVQSGRRTVAEQLAQGPSTPGHPVAGPNGPHVRGVAADITPGYGTFGKLAERFGLGFTVMPQEPWHIQLIKALSGLGATAAPTLRRMLVDGPASPLHSMVQSALDTARAGAQARMQALAQTMTGPEGGEVSIGPADGSGAELMRSIAKQRGWNFADWWALDGSETSHGRNLSNPTSTARLRGQFLSSNWGAYGPGSDPAANPTMAQQIWSMAEYIAERYVNPTKAWAFHRAHNWYQHGGPVGMQPGGPAPNTASGTGNTSQPGRAPDGRKHPVTLASTLRTIRRSKSPKIRGEALHRMLDKIKGIGLPKSLQKRLATYAGDANAYGDLASRAERLTVTPDDGSAPIQGVVQGKTQAQWLTDQLQSLFKWRNAIIRAEAIVVAKREETAKLIARARTRLKTVTTEIRTAAKTRKTLAGQLTKAQKKPKANRTLIKSLRGKIKDLDAGQRGRTRLRDTIHDRILPALTGKRTSLNTARGELLSNLETVQGFGSPMEHLDVIPTVGVLGGQIFDVQTTLRDLAVKPKITDAAPTDESPGNEVLAELLRQANLRTAVSEKQFEALRNMPPFGGSFATGGVVPGPAGAPRTIVAHGGETVTPAAGGDGSRVRVLIQDERVRVYVDDVEQIVHQVNRRTSNRAGRGLPGRGGGGLG